MTGVSSASSMISARSPADLRLRLRLRRFFAGLSASSLSPDSAVSGVVSVSSDLGAFAGFSARDLSPRALRLLPPSRVNTGISMSSAGSAPFSVRRTLARLPNMPNSPGLPISMT